jgi:hypothetical protein
MQGQAEGGLVVNVQNKIWGVMSAKVEIAKKYSTGLEMHVFWDQKKSV